MFACVIYVSVNLRTIIPITWIYQNTEVLKIKKHYLAYFNDDKSKMAPPIELLKFNNSNKLQDNEVYKIFLYKLIGEYI